MKPRTIVAYNCVQAIDAFAHFRGSVALLVNTNTLGLCAHSVNKVTDFSLVRLEPAN